MMKIPNNQRLNKSFQTKKEQNNTAMKDIRNLFRLKKIKGIKDIVHKNIKYLLGYEKEEENYYESIRVNNFWNNDQIECKSNSDKNKILSVEQYLNKIRPYWRHIINDLKQSDTWKIQSTIAINLISSIDDNNGDCIMHSKSDNIELGAVMEQMKL